ncbi:MAG TPA: winged helix DNA-binding domain-containing protein [Candidatus Saccharimonadales bacterium]|nr:winged helix DNA-binding domain-containing protein [Candidatus Saccharimonadales bacterium]
MPRVTDRSALAALPMLSDRALGRALLERQLLLKRAAIAAETAIARLAGLQAQWSPAPYIGLWSRLVRFAIPDLEGALADHTVVKATVMRGTLHLLSAAEFPLYAVATAAARTDLWRNPKLEDGIDMDALEARLRRYTATTPRSFDELASFIDHAAPGDRDRQRYLIRRLVFNRGAMVHTPPSGTWRHYRTGGYVAGRSWVTGWREPSIVAATDHVVTRHLGAFGPATVDDVGSWSSIRTPLIRESLARIRGITRFRDARGRELFDLTGSPRPDPESPAPVRFLPKWDSTLLAYAAPERVRILPEAYRKAVIMKNGDVVQTILVDGMVAGSWTTAVVRGEAVLTVTPFAKISRVDRAALAEEGERLVRFIEPEAKRHGVAV